MEHELYSKKSPGRSSAKWSEASNRTVRRALKRSILELQETKNRLFAENMRSPLGVRMAVVCAELGRIQLGLPIRTASLVRIFNGLRAFDVPLRKQPAPAEMANIEQLA